MHKTKLSTALLKAAQLQQSVEDIFDDHNLIDLSNHDRLVLMAIASESHGETGCATNALHINSLTRNVATATLQRSLARLKQRDLITSSGGTRNKFYYLKNDT